MATISAKFNVDEVEKLQEICETLQVDKSEALRQATHQLWLALQIGQPFVERAGGRPKYLLNSGSTQASTRDERNESIDRHIQERAAKRRRSKPRQDSE